MKKEIKYIMAVALIGGLMIARPAVALDCPADVGTLFNGTKSGTYCASKIRMTWWSAFTWCEAIGGKLATWAEACPGSAVGSMCTNMKDSGGPDKWAWTATPYQDNRAYVVNLSSGVVGSGDRASTIYYYALCK